MEVVVFEVDRDVGDRFFHDRVEPFGALAQQFDDVMAHPGVPVFLEMIRRVGHRLRFRAMMKEFRDLVGVVNELGVRRHDRPPFEGCGRAA